LLICRLYAESDQRVFEVPCPSCGVFSEIMWRHIEWEPDRPNTAAFRCPHCETLIDESHNPAMVGAGTWRATHPEVTGHHGYRLNSLVSLLPNVSWTVLAREFLQAKDHRDRLMSFITTKLAEPWREQADESSEGELAARAHRGRDRHHNCSPLSGRDRERNCKKVLQKSAKQAGNPEKSMTKNVDQTIARIVVC